MLTDKNPVFGLVQLATGFKRAEQDANANRRVGLSALRTHLLAIYTAKTVEDIGVIDAVEAKGRLKAHLREKVRSPAYIRNQISALSHVLRCAERVPGGTDVPSLWVPLLDQAIQTVRAEDGAPGVHQHAHAREVFLAFVRAEGISPKTFIPSQHLTVFRSYLVKRHGLAANGMARTHKRHIARLLAQMGYELPVQTRPTPLPETFEQDIVILGEYATNSAPEHQTASGKKGLFAEMLGNPNPIRPNTWKVTAQNLHQYLNFHRARHPMGFERTSLATWLEIRRVQEFFVDAHERGAMTKMTGETWIVRLNRIHSYACAQKVRGFECAKPDEHELYHKEIWSLIPHLRKGMRKSATQERIKARGGLPTFEDIHRAYEVSAATQAKLIATKLRAAKAKVERDPERAKQLRLQAALAARELLMVSFHLYVACRKHDMKNTIRADSLHKLSDQLVHLHYTPSKTSGQPRPPVVDCCLPPWLTPLVNLYLTELQQLIYPGAALLFPANIRNKTANADVAQPGEAKGGNYSDWLTRVSTKYFGHQLGATHMRYILTNFFAKHGLTRLYCLLGHNPDFRTSALTAMESENYLRWGDRERLQHAERHYDGLIELLNVSEEFVRTLTNLKKSPTT